MRPRLLTLLSVAVLAACDASESTPLTETDGETPVLAINGGVKITGAGDQQQWEGVVGTNGGRGLCTAAFISERHLITASHCYAANSTVSLKLTAPTWDNGAPHTFSAKVMRSGSNQTLDVAVIDLGKAVEWATPARRFVLHAGKVTGPVTLHMYGFGVGNSNGTGVGTFRGSPGRSTISVTEDSRGNLNGKASATGGICEGDSGGPAFVENTAAVLYGINQAGAPSGFTRGECATTGWGIVFTNVSKYVPFIEQSIGKKCERKQVDGLEVAQCW